MIMIQHNHLHTTSTIPTFEKQNKFIQHGLGQIYIQFAVFMTYQSGHRRHKSSFQKGMTLEQYLRGMEFRQQSIPTADSRSQDVQLHAEEQNLYKTSHQFYNPYGKSKVNPIKEIEEQNCEDSLEQQRENFNIAVSNAQMTRKQPVQAEDKKKNFRIRNGKSNSPYQNHKQEFQNSPFKTHMKNFYDSEQSCKILKTENKQTAPRTLFGKQLEIRKSKKNLKIEGFDFGNRNNNRQVGISDKLVMEKIDLRAEIIKERVQMKKKNKIKG